MRHVFHRILNRYLERYLDGSLYTFDTSPRELWPEPRASWHPTADRATGAPALERGRHHRVYGELESQN
jgi:hypothetical protein